MFIKTVVKQGNKIIRLEKENKKLKEINQDLREEHNEYLIFKYKTEQLIDSTIRDLFNIQDIDRLGIGDQDKKKHRNIIINQIVKGYMEKIKELDRSSKQI